MGDLYHPKYQTLIAKLRKARLDAGLTQVTAGKQLGKPQSYISKIERGERYIGALEVADFAKTYKKPINFFLK
ncbi:helix-turn-helix transcriptional regulator [Candidatus Kaiserbacteria bacterium]|nr:helix-turn-helix transcriptional regulator [Candidatus Kaiserbacteria bacterium]